MGRILSGDTDFRIVKSTQGVPLGHPSIKVKNMTIKQRIPKEAEEISQWQILTEEFIERHQDQLG